MIFSPLANRYSASHFTRQCSNSPPLLSAALISKEALVVLLSPTGSLGFLPITNPPAPLFTHYIEFPILPPAGPPLLPNLRNISPEHAPSTPQFPLSSPVSFFSNSCSRTPPACLPCHSPHSSPSLYFFPHLQHTSTSSAIRHSDPPVTARLLSSSVLLPLTLDNFLANSTFLSVDLRLVVEALFVLIVSSVPLDLFLSGSSLFLFILSLRHADCLVKTFPWAFFDYTCKLLPSNPFLDVQGRPFIEAASLVTEVVILEFFLACSGGAPEFFCDHRHRNFFAFLF